MREPLTDDEITGMRVLVAMGEHLAEVAKKSSRPIRFLLSRFTYDLLQRDMPSAIERRHGQKYLWIRDRFDPLWCAEAQVTVTDDVLPWIEHVMVDGDIHGTRLTYGAQRIIDRGAISVL